MVDFFLWALDQVREPLHDVLGIITEHLADVIEPRAGLCRVAWSDRRRPVEIEAGHIVPSDPSAFGYQSIADQHGQAGRPGHLLNRPVLIEPRAGGHGLGLAVLAE